MANFGTYEGHKILSNAMSNTVKTIQDAFDDKTQRQQWQDTFDQNKLEQDRRFNQHVREENRRFGFDKPSTTAEGNFSDGVSYI